MTFPSLCTVMFAVRRWKHAKDDKGKRQNAGKQYRTPNQFGKIRAIGNDCVQLIWEDDIGEWLKPFLRFFIVMTHPKATSTSAEIHKIILDCLTVIPGIAVNRDPRYQIIAVISQNK